VLDHSRAAVLLPLQVLICQKDFSLSDAARSVASVVCPTQSSGMSASATSRGRHATGARRTLLARSRGQLVELFFVWRRPRLSFVTVGTRSVLGLDDGAVIHAAELREDHIDHLR